MARKKAGEQDNLWSHPDFNRDVATKALNKALELGRAVQFLPLTGYAQGQNRREASANSQDSLFSLSRSDTLTSMPAVLTSRMRKKQTSSSGDKMRKLSNSFTSIETHYREQQQRRMQLSSGAQSAFRTINQGYTNSTFEAVSPHTTGMLFSSFSSSSGPSASMFAGSVQNTTMLSPPQQQNANVQRSSMISSSSDGDDQSSALQRRQLLQSELTPEENKELSDFLGWFAQTLPDNEECGGESDRCHFRRRTTFF